MNLKAITDCISQYKTIIEDPQYDGWTLWELTTRFQDNWNQESHDFKKMFEDCFAINSPLWHRDDYYPKKAMQRYIDLNEDLVRSIFKDLFNQDREVVGRISRFMFQCDELYRTERSKFTNLEPHFHSDRRMIHMYLGFRYPDDYALYNFPHFKAFMNKIGSKSIAEEEDIDRFIKVCKTLSTLIQKDEELTTFIRNCDQNPSRGELYPMLIVFELYSLVDYYN
jgi:hypothetical protein